jgi:hypothetical protein
MPGDNEPPNEIDNDDPNGGIDSSVDLNAAKLIQSELLAYVAYYVNKCAPQSIIDTVCTYFSSQDIIDAKNVLWNVAEDALQANKPRRNNADMDKATKMKMVEYIVLKGMVPLADVNDFHVRFCAINLDKMPKFSPEEDGVQAVLLRVMKLEQRLAENEKLSAQNSLEITDMKMNGRPGAGTPYRPFSAPDKPLRYSAVASSNLGSSSEVQASSSSQPFGQSSSHSISKSLPRGVYSMPQTSGSTQEDWQFQRNQRREPMKQIRENAKSVTGTKADSNIKCAEDIRSIYVCEINQEVTEQAIKDMITENGVPVLQMTQILGRRGGFKKSFKVLIPARCLEQTMTGDFWPTGLKCREWVLN